MTPKELKHLVLLGLVRPVEVRKHNGRGGYQIKIHYELTTAGRQMARETGATRVQRTIAESRAQQFELEREIAQTGLRINLLKPRLG